MDGRPGYSGARSPDSAYATTWYHASWGGATGASTSRRTRPDASDTSHSWITAPLPTSRTVSRGAQSGAVTRMEKTTGSSGLSGTTVSPRIASPAVNSMKGAELAWLRPAFMAA